MKNFYFIILKDNILELRELIEKNKKISKKEFSEIELIMNKFNYKWKIIVILKIKKKYINFWNNHLKMDLINNI